MTLFAMFLAIEIVLVMTPLGFLRLGVLDITLMHLPVILTAVTMGKKAGMQMGFVFGVCSIMNATLRPGITSFVFSPFIEIAGVHGNWASLIVAIVPRVAIGYVSAVCYETIHKKETREKTALFMAGLLGSLTNTVLVLAGIYVFFGPAYAEAIHVSYEMLLLALGSVIVTNSIFEAIFASVLTVWISRAIKQFI